MQLDDRLFLLLYKLLRIIHIEVKKQPSVHLVHLQQAVDLPEDQEQGHFTLRCRENGNQRGQAAQEREKLRAVARDKTTLR